MVKSKKQQNRLFFCKKIIIPYSNGGFVSMKDINFELLIAGLVICAALGVVTLLIFQDLSFSGMCIIATAILYSSSLQSRDS